MREITTEVRTFPFEFQGNQVRVVVGADGEPWWVASDVCRVLGIGNPSQAISRLDHDEKITLTNNEGNPRMGIPHQYTVVNEPGLYGLVLQSRKPDAKEFKRWVKHEVLPAIRKHGVYMTPQRIEEVLMDPDTIIKIALQLKEERAKRIEAERLIEEQAPKVTAYDRLMSSDRALSVRDAAKIISDHGFIIGEKKLFARLRDWNWLMITNEPYQRYMNAKYFERITGTTPAGFAYSQTLVTPKGLVAILERLMEERYAA